MTSVIDQINRALDMTAAIVKGITDDQFAAPTPCPDWDVRAELNHLAGGMRIFTAELTATDAGADHDADWLGANPPAAFATAADLDRAAWHRPNVLDTTVCLGFGAVPGTMAALIHLTEVLVHGADLAIATGQGHLVDERACAELLTIMQGMDFDIFRRPGMFGSAVPVPADAPAHRRLLAFVGRSLAPH
ncbi:MULTISPECIES: TIGR03086 family metal-binding protein [unclassified Pseudofrankia]|uniref:TIGR03086 family metal-binding protein n=1 Tax=unclassified Pseudofrankia TaxID=2994372 RepID=UPI0008D98581|nr:MULTISPECIES: TIGR03086 family metal-binding protein [unclassified Pseudofrankia]MDT3442762.1 TIGR03086 family metal-binding protein [Pseudofrankia sp. BMG5.37]OHV44214.1 TIGR03086 family protein [Pseudofrankia sp. BMG5.36]